MTAATPRPRPAAGPFAALLGAIAIAIGTQLVGTVPAPDLPADFAEPLLELSATDPDETIAGTPDPVSELSAIHAEIAFWGDRLRARPTDLVSAVRLGDAHIAEARAAGDVTAYLRAEAALTTALTIQPAYVPALARRASVLVALHRFSEARDVARTVLASDPANLVALGALGDAALELGAIGEARRAYEALSVVADGSASRVRRARLAFLEGDGVQAVADARAALDASLEDDATGASLAFANVVLADLLAATGDGASARATYDAALAARSGWPAALVGLARLDAAAGDLDGAIRRMDAAIAELPSPESFARRADLYLLRDGPGDATRAADDLATVEAIAQLAGDAASVHDRALVLFLADHGRDPDRAVAMARSELEIRRDVYGYDAYAWALLADGRPDEADAAMGSALALGTRDARLLYHAGMIALANGRPAEALARLTEALDLEPGFDPVGAARARQVLETLR